LVFVFVLLLEVIEILSFIFSIFIISCKLGLILNNLIFSSALDAQAGVQVTCNPSILGLAFVTDPVILSKGLLLLLVFLSRASFLIQLVDVHFHHTLCKVVDESQIHFALFDVGAFH
jgi:hypothetical protein